MSGREILRFAEFDLDLGERTLSRNGAAVPLTPKAFDLLSELALGAPKLLSKEYLLSKVWPNTFISDATLAQNIHSIRTALGTPDAIVTVPKSGYRFALAVERTQPAVDQAEEAPAEPSKRNWVRPVASVVLLIVTVAALTKAGATVAAWYKADQLAREGLVLMRRSDHAGLVKATANFRASLEANPHNARAIAGQAEASRRLGLFSPDFRLAAAERAVALEPGCGECHGILGFLLMTDHWAWARAARELETAIAQEPENFQFRIWQSQLFAATGRGKEAIRSAREAVRLAPERASPYVMLAGAFYLNRRYVEAAGEYRKALSIVPAMPSALVWNHQTLLMCDRHKEAMEIKLRHDSSYMGYSTDTEQKLLAELWQRWGRSGFKGELRWRLNEYAQPEAADRHRYDRAIWRMFLGEREQALDELERALETKSFQMIYLALDPIFEPLHGTPRFESLLARMGLQR